MIKIEISNNILDICPQFDFRAIECIVQNSSSNAELWEEINEFTARFSKTHKISDINKRSTILATRQAYKALGKEPNRYRPSAEALSRRIVKGEDLYRIDTLVDLINLVSLKSGYSIGGFDAEKIQGNLVLGVGKVNEEFEAIGRGLLNIENMPVYRDNKGGIGTPSSDVERTKITADTKKLLVIINGYSGTEGLDQTAEWTKNLLIKYANAKNFSIKSLHAEKAEVESNI